MITDEVKKAYVRELLRKGKRADGRGLMDYREVKIERGFVPNAEGSALVSIGDTKVLAGVKLDLAMPFPDRPEEGVLSFNSEFCPVAHPSFEPGPPNEHSIELARVVDRGIRSAECIDLKGLAKTGSETGKVMGVYCDLYILDQCGNLIDCASVAAMAALASAKVPKFEAEKLVRGDYSGNLPLQRKCVSTSFESIEGHEIVDATYDEQSASDGRLTISTTDDGFVCAGQKSGAVGFSREKMSVLTQRAFEKGAELLKKI